jgi:hypothetical protein
MTATRYLKALTALAVLTTSVSCGDVVRQGRSSVFLVVNQLTAIRGGNDQAEESGTLLSDVLTNVTSPDPCKPTAPCPTVFNDMAKATFRISPKDIGSATASTSPSTNNEVTITHYRVDYRRADGRNRQGIDVPFGFDGAATGTVPSGGTLELAFELVRHNTKMESPLVQLIISKTIISTIADVTFFGRDQVGNEVSVTASILVEFGNFGDF